MVKEPNSPVIIIDGYEKDMHQLIETNPSLKRRIKYKVFLMTTRTMNLESPDLVTSVNTIPLHAWYAERTEAHDGFTSFIFFTNENFFEMWQFHNL